MEQGPVSPSQGCLGGFLRASIHRRLQEGDRGEQSPRCVSLRSVFFAFLLLVNSVVFHDADSRCRHAVLKLLAKRGPGNKPRTARGLRSARGGGEGAVSIAAGARGAGVLVLAGVRWSCRSRGRWSVPVPKLHSTPRHAPSLHAAATPTDTPHATATRAPPPTRQGARAGPGQAIQLCASCGHRRQHTGGLSCTSYMSYVGRYTSARSSLFALTKRQKADTGGVYSFLYIIHYCIENSVHTSTQSRSRESET